MTAQRRPSRTSQIARWNVAVNPDRRNGPDRRGKRCPPNFPDPSGRSKSRPGGLPSTYPLRRHAGKTHTRVFRFAVALGGPACWQRPSQQRRVKEAQNFLGGGPRHIGDPVWGGGCRLHPKCNWTSPQGWPSPALPLGHGTGNVRRQPAEPGQPDLFPCRPARRPRDTRQPAYTYRAPSRKMALSFPYDAMPVNGRLRPAAELAVQQAPGQRHVNLRP